MKTYTFRVVLEPDEDGLGNSGWAAYCPALVRIGGASSGRTKEEALRNLREAVELVIESLLEHGEPIPESPSDAVEVLEVSLDAPTITISA